MKTKMKKIAVALILAVSVSGTSASELENYEFSMRLTENSLEVEQWMLNAGFFEPAEKDASESTVVEIAISNPDFSILVDAIVKAGLAETLSAEGPFTVFAPTNEAFETLFSHLGISGVADLSSGQLVPILTYHVVSGKVMSTDLTNSMVSTLNEDNKLKVDLTKGVKINDSNVVAADISGKNGVIHVIDKVLLPE